MILLQHLLLYRKHPIRENWLCVVQKKKAALVLLLWVSCQPTSDRQTKLAICIGHLRAAADGFQWQAAAVFLLVNVTNPVFILKGNCSMYRCIFLTVPPPKTEKNTILFLQKLSRIIVVPIKKKSAQNISPMTSDQMKLQALSLKRGCENILSGCKF